MFFRNSITCTFVGAIGALGSLVFAPSVSEAGITYLTQSRSVSTELRELFARTDGDLFLVDSDSATASDFGLFDAVVDASVGGKGFGHATQTSTLADTGIDFTGIFSGNTETSFGNHFERTRLTTDFTLDAPASFALLVSIVNPFLEIDERSIRLERLDVPETLADITVAFPDSDRPVFEDSVLGEAAAGTYRATFDLSISPDYAGGATFTYAVSLQLTEIDGPVVIPLPPAAWGGLVMLGGIIFTTLKRLRRD